MTVTVPVHATVPTQQKLDKMNQFVKQEARQYIQQLLAQGKWVKLREILDYQQTIHPNRDFTHQEIAKYRQQIRIKQK